MSGPLSRCRRSQFSRVHIGRSQRTDSLSLNDIREGNEDLPAAGITSSVSWLRMREDLGIPGDVRVKLEFLDERRFGNGFVFLRYRTKA